MTDSAAEYVEERDAALRTLDIAWAKKRAPYIREEAILIAMHKARYEATSIEDGLRLESRVWLEGQGYSRLGGLPFPENKLELPK